MNAAEPKGKLLKVGSFKRWPKKSTRIVIQRAAKDEMTGMW